MRSSTVSLKWEQKIATQCLKSVVINAFVLYRMLKAQDRLDSPESYKSLRHFRDAMNGVESLSIFLFKATRELLIYASDLADRQAASEHPEVSGPPGLELEEQERLMNLAKSRKRNRLQWFNTDDGISLR